MIVFHLEKEWGEHSEIINRVDKSFKAQEDVHDLEH